jgi:glycosyltransferase involved in cell wall biosynthesis
MYASEFDTTECAIENKIVFASAWVKNLPVIIKLFRSLLLLSDVRLELMSPGYEYPAFLEYKKILEDEFKERIFIHGPLKKQDYCKVLKSSICVLAPRFPETFGCVFAESYYLGVPVIADIHSGAVKEIIDNNYIVDYDYPEKVHEKIQLLKTRPNIQLDEKFLTSIDKWEELLKEY